MIDRQFGKVVFECDGCEDTIETGESEWPDAQRIFRALNWKAEKVGADWVHTCPRCEGKQ